MVSIVWIVYQKIKIMKRKIKKVNGVFQIQFESQTWIPGFQGYTKTLKTDFNEGDVVKVNTSSSGIGVTKNGVSECWIMP